MMLSKENSSSFLHKLLRHLPDLPFEPALIPKLLAMTREDSTASARDLASLIERSQKLTARVLTIANSAAYSLRFKVSSLQQGIVLLGSREISRLASFAGMASAIGMITLPKGFDITAEWRHQLRVAFIARSLAKELGGYSGICGPSAKEEDRLSITPEEAYIAGLMHDIGKFFFAASRPDLWKAVEITWKKDTQRYFEAENEYWGIDHALIGAMVLHSWRMPFLLTEPVNWHHMPELATSYKMEARLLAAADHIARSDLNAKNGLCEEAVSLLPAGIDGASLGAAMTRSLTSANIEVLAAYV